MNLKNRVWITIILLGFLPILFVYNNCAPMSGKLQASSQTGSGGGDSDQPFPGDNSGGNGGLPDSPAIPADATEGEIFFLTNVVPKMNSFSCVNCHTAPRFTATPAPLTLFNYDLMLLKIAQGSSISNNAFITKPLGGANHGGGNQCAGGPFSEPCKVFTDWAKVEFPTWSSGASGSLTSLSARGLVTGWAVDPADQKAVLQVHIYADGPAGVGGIANKRIVIGLKESALPCAWITFPRPTNIDLIALALWSKFRSHSQIPLSNQGRGIPSLL